MEEDTNNNNMNGKSVKNKIVNYNGAKIIKSEQDVLKELEKQVGRIPVVPQLSWDTFGVRIEDNRVVGLVI